MTSQTPFLKNYEGKPMLSLLPWAEIEQVAKVADHGAEKYSRDNWKNGKPDDYLSAALRHVSARAQGNRIDESGHPNLAHAICDLLFVLWMDNNSKTTPEQAMATFAWGGFDEGKEDCIFISYPSEKSETYAKPAI